MKLDFAILADGASRREDGKLDIFGAGVDQVNAAGVPARHAMLTLVVRFSLTRGDLARAHRLSAVLRGKAGPDLAELRGTFEGVPLDERKKIKPGGIRHFVAVLQFPDIVFPDVGEYEIVVSWDDKPAGEPIPLVVALATDDASS